jgi:hypothetical protein
MGFVAYISRFAGRNFLTHEPVPDYGSLDDDGCALSHKPWTGKKYNASVYSVSRVHETVYSRVDDLEHLTPYWDQNFLPIAVNVVFCSNRGCCKPNAGRCCQSGGVLNSFRDGKIGVLERALVAKEDGIHKKH